MASQVTNKRSLVRFQAKPLKLIVKAGESQPNSLNSPRDLYFGPPSDSKHRAKDLHIEKAASRDRPFKSGNCTLSQSTSFRQLHRSPRASVVVNREPLGAIHASTTNLSSLVKSIKGSGKGKDSCYREHLFHTFQAMKFIKTLRQPTLQELNSKLVHLNKRKDCEHKKTVVFDLDETLVHCEEDPTAGDVPITVTFPNGQEVVASIRVRPFAREVLRAANNDYEVIVFTASHKCYADKVLDYLDPTGELIHHRLYRDDCLVVDGLHLKDLRILSDRKLEEIVIVDNAAYSFAYQLHNGIPIISWYNDPSDKELYKLIAYLRCLARTTDVRLLNQQTFKLETFYEDYLAEITKSKENTRN